MSTRSSAFIQAIRGPVLLVTIGVLFAIHQAGVLSFSRTWPLLIIVLGVMKLLERTTAPPHAWPDPQHSGYPTPGAGPYPPPAGTSQHYRGSNFPPQGPGGSNA
jgi:hypothetical protein